MVLYHGILEQVNYGKMCTIVNYGIVYYGIHTMVFWNR